MIDTGTKRIPALGAELHVRREGIRFHNVAHERVEIEIEVENLGQERSEPAPLRLEAAPFGAFVPWRPLATLVVPSIPPLGRAIVRTVVRQQRPRALAGLAGLIPPRLLAPAGADEEQRPATRTGLAGIQARVLLSLVSGGNPLHETHALPADLLDLLDSPRLHWAGNLNVHVGRQPVERHMAPRLRVHPGRSNVAMFMVGSRSDAYTFQVEAPPDWQTGLLGPDGPIGRDPAEPRWHAFPGMLPVIFAVRPPEDCERGAVAVHVTRRSTKTTAVVEFDLDPSAAGPGCFLA